jgi:hypothetical protein
MFLELHLAITESFGSNHVKISTKRQLERIIFLRLIEQAISFVKTRDQQIRILPLYAFQVRL